MREIKFRGKTKHNGWIYGDLTGINCNMAEHHNWAYINGSGVDKRTLGQYTGLKDKNGKEIYEGDIVKHYCMIEDKELLAKVEFREGSFMIGVYHLRDKIVEIKSNIYENPELLEVR